MERDSLLKRVISFSRQRIFIATPPEDLIMTSLSKEVNHTTMEIETVKKIILSACASYYFAVVQDERNKDKDKILVFKKHSDKKNDLR